MPLGSQRRVDIASKLAMVRRPTLTELGRKRGDAEKADTPPPHTHTLCPDILVIPSHCPRPVLHHRITEA